MADNDGRKPTAWLPELIFEGAANPVVQVIAEQTGEILCTVRVAGDRFQPPVFSQETFTVKAGRDRPDGQVLANLTAHAKTSAGQRTIPL